MRVFKQVSVNFFHTSCQSIYETELTFLEMPAVEGKSPNFYYTNKKLVTEELTTLG